MERHIFKSNNEEETKKFARNFAANLGQKKVVVLTGELRFW